MPADAPAAPVSTLLARLRAETRPHHEALEQNPFNQALLAQRLDAAAVAWFLGRLYGFLVPYEAHLQTQGLGPAWAVAERRRAALIRHDLGAAVAEALPRCPALPPLDTPARLLGAMYVVEGSTLGGQLIGRALAQAGLPPSAYFTGYGARTGELWKQFGQQLAATVVAPTEQDAVVASAISTFQHLAAWINQP